MAQYSIANQAGALFRAALNTVLGKLQRNYFGTTDPASAGESTAGMWWVDSSSGTPILKIRNGSDNGWIDILSLDTTQYYRQLLERLRLVFSDSTGSFDCDLRNVARFRYFESVNGALTFQLGTSQCLINANPRPSTTGGFSLGDAFGRWSTTFLVNAPNVSSDFRLKEDFGEFTETDLQAALLFKPQPFRLKADGKRTSGYVAQQIIYAFELAGLERDAAERRAVELGLLEMGEDGMWGVHYELVNALRIEALARRA